MRFRSANIRGRFLRGAVAIAVCWVRSEGVFVLSAAETWYEGVCLRLMPIFRALDTVSIGVKPWSCKDEADSITCLGHVDS
jgi:hypothetical protein